MRSASLGVIVVLDVLLGQLAAIRAQRGIEVFDRLHARDVARFARRAHRVERAHDLLLAADDIERGQLPQPRCRDLGRDQRIGGFLGSGVQKSEHGVKRCILTYFWRKSWPDPGASAIRICRRSGSGADIYRPILPAAQSEFRGRLQSV
jgi:hypothetical protein